MLLNHLEIILLHPNLWKNCLPGNWSLVPKKVGDLWSRRWKRGASGLKSGQWMRLYDSLGASQVVLVVKTPPTNAGNIGDVGSIPGLRRSPGKGHGNPPQYSCLENSMDGGVWQAIVHGVTKSWVWLKRLSTHLFFLVFQMILWWYFKMWIFLIKSRLLDSFEKTEAVWTLGLHPCMETMSWSWDRAVYILLCDVNPHFHQLTQQTTHAISLLHFSVFPFVLSWYLSWPPWSSATLPIYRWDIEAQR